ncbi:PfkB family carbohydrate kinase [Gryllotalpicola ginsengisoli]|uniref:PfkB family carbohydrate kinase n=1 Tax=Gryllotalpicola ginsengisoli TaxID=444608 RepID=UPI0003B3E2E8|nr:PfkB family carbohydrate kinase [Gryllotalpicola ginsengisoli]
MNSSPTPPPRPTTRVAVVGQLARDLVLCVGGVPEAGGSTPVVERRELFGGKGANHALALHQLGAAVDLVAVAGDDRDGDWVLEQAADSGIGTAAVTRRGTTALLVDVVEPGGTRRLLEHVPDEALLTVADVRAARDELTDADTVCLQLQQPPDALLEAARIASEAGARLVLDGAVEGAVREELLRRAEVVRADAKEAQLLTGIRISSRGDAERAATALLDAGPRLVALGVPGAGDLVAWPGGSVFLPFGEENPVDPTGAGDAFLAGLVTGVRDGLGPEQAAQLAARSAADTVARLGGHPELAGLRPGAAR